MWDETRKKCPFSGVFPEIKRRRLWECSSLPPSQSSVQKEHWQASWWFCASTWCWFAAKRKISTMPINLPKLFKEDNVNCSGTALVPLFGGITPSRMHLCSSRANWLPFQILRKAHHSYLDRISILLVLVWTFFTNLSFWDSVARNVHCALDELLQKCSAQLAWPEFHQFSQSKEFARWEAPCQIMGLPYTEHMTRLNCHCRN